MSALGLSRRSRLFSKASSISEEAGNRSQVFRSQVFRSQVFRSQVYVQVSGVQVSGVQVYDQVCEFSGVFKCVKFVSSSENVNLDKPVLRRFGDGFLRSLVATQWEKKRRSKNLSKLSCSDDVITPSLQPNDEGSKNTPSSPQASDSNGHSDPQEDPGQRPVSTLSNDKKFLLDMLFSKSSSAPPTADTTEEEEESHFLPGGQVLERLSSFKSRSEDPPPPNASVREELQNLQGSTQAARNRLDQETQSRLLRQQSSIDIETQQRRLEATPLSHLPPDAWEQLQPLAAAALKIKDLDFSDLLDEEDVDVLDMDTFDSFHSSHSSHLTGLPPPPPPLPGGFSPAPSSPSSSWSPAPPSLVLLTAEEEDGEAVLEGAAPGAPPPLCVRGGTVWASLDKVSLDTKRLEHLFQSKAKEMSVVKKGPELKKSELLVLDSKRSNAINIGMTVLPAVHVIKTAILNFDEFAISKEGIELGMEQLSANQTFRRILATLLAIGNFLNSSMAAGFELSYLEKVVEVKDTVHRQSLLHHTCCLVLENYPESSDLYSEVPAITRSSKVDFELLSENLVQLERRCKASWENLKLVTKHETKASLKNKLTEFLKDCTQRIVILKVVHRRVINRFHSFLLFLGQPPPSVRDIRVTSFCRIISEFSLEFRTTRDRVLTLKRKRATHRERTKTRGKMITEQGLIDQEQQEEHENMKNLLICRTSESGNLRRSRAVRSMGRVSPSQMSTGREDGPGCHDDATDEIMDRLVKSVTQNPADRPASPKNRKRSRVNRKSTRSAELA
ncbi:FH1/FH2 domain containing protein 3 [Dissostichus eleginoides]|uniref:FH1/FH2 domain containing protein 3 n=1 Tax=Dissostichus eleginoides TaxID=100907 RepID=A0AAD9B571_DISEL|nr:FH1/FH2 domain containing protein 3 [Dissostichus eleginoides]